MKFIAPLFITLLTLFGLIFFETNSSASAQTSSAPTTLLIGIVSFDDDLEFNAPDIFYKAKLGSIGHPDFHAVFLYDDYKIDGSTIVYIHNGQTTAEAIPKINVGDPVELAHFVAGVRADYNAEREFLTLVGHGALPMPQISWEGDLPLFEESPTVGDGYQLSPEFYPATPEFYPATPKFYPATPEFYPATGDDGAGNYDFLSTPEMGEFLALATDDGAKPFDILLFDQCFQGSLASLYEVKDSAEIIIASPNYGWASYPYDYFADTFASGFDNETTANTILTNYQASLDENHPNSIFWVNTDDLETLKNHVSQLGVALIDYLEPNVESGRDSILDLQSQLRYVDSNFNFEMETPDEYVTLHSLATALRSLNNTAITEQADSILAILDNLGSERISGSPYFAPNKTWSFGDNDTITILFPLPTSTDSGQIWRSYLYANAGTQLSVSHEGNHAVGTVSQPLALTQSSYWDDFINYWYPDQTSIEISPWIQAPYNAVSGALFDFEDNVQWAHHYSRAATSKFVDGTFQINYNNLLLDNTIAFKSSNFSSSQDWSDYNWLTIDVQGQNSGNEIQIYLDGEESGRYMHIFTDDFEGWDTIIVPLNSSGFILDHQESFDQNSLFAFDDIYRIGIEVRTRNPENISGSIHVDNIQVVGETSHETIFDFDESPRKWRAHYSSIGHTKIIDGVMHIIYNDLAPSQYFAHKSRNVPVTVWDEYETISFSIKGENTGHKVTINLDSPTSGWANYSIVDNSSEWRHIVIPIDDFNSRNGRPTDIGSIGIQLKNQSSSPSSGVIQIDNIMINQ